jgi:hypothetical protein
MAYFPNGSSFAYWQDEHCSDCLNYRDNGSGSFGCAITDAHFLLADKMHGKRGGRTAVSKTLDHFIPDEGVHAGECRMRLTPQMVADAELAERQRQDRERYEAALNEARAA